MCINFNSLFYKREKFIVENFSRLLYSRLLIMNLGFYFITLLLFNDLFESIIIFSSNEKKFFLLKR